MGPQAQTPETASSTSPSGRYAAIRSASEWLCEPLRTEDFVVQTMTDVSPTKWHLAHTSWFFETFVLEPNVPGYRPFHPQFRVLFNSYYQTVGAMHARPRRGLLSRPTVADVYDYRAHVDASMRELLQNGPVDKAVADVIELGLHHEQQHQELILTDIKHVFSVNPLRPTYRSDPPLPADAGAPALTWQDFPEGLRTLGHDADTFAFDNEGPRHRVFLGQFKLASRLVTCGEFLEFMEDGGYQRPDLWLSDGWDAVQRGHWQAPEYWDRRDDEWWMFTLQGMRRVDADRPVCHVSHYEADAFARWTGYRLPNEAEWEVAARDVPQDDGNFVETRSFHPCAARSEPGLQQMFGDVWEWTQTPYGAYPGYRAPTGALGEYNGKFMSGQIVLRGGSCATPASHIRASYRNFFHPPARWQFSGIRLARDE